MNASSRKLLNPQIQHHAKEQGIGYDLNMIFDGSGLELPPRPTVVFSSPYPKPPFLLAKAEKLRLGALGMLGARARIKLHSPNSTKKRLGNWLCCLLYATNLFLFFYP